MGVGSVCPGVINKMQQDKNGIGHGQEVLMSNEITGPIHRKSQ